MLHAKHSNYVGKHLILDLYNVNELLLTHIQDIKQCLIKAAWLADATIIEDNFHEFGGEGGITGTIILAESHISIHTWPEYKYAALDIFMCGKCDPEKSISSILEYFKTSKYEKNIIYRGPDPFIKQNITGKLR